MIVIRTYPSPMGDVHLGADYTSQNELSQRYVPGRSSLWSLCGGPIWVRSD